MMIILLFRFGMRQFLLRLDTLLVFVCSFGFTFTKLIVYSSDCRRCML